MTCICVSIGVKIFRSVVSVREKLQFFSVANPSKGNFIFEIR